MTRLRLGLAALPFCALSILTHAPACLAREPAGNPGAAQLQPLQVQPAQLQPSQAQPAQLQPSQVQPAQLQPAPGPGSSPGPVVMMPLEPGRSLELPVHGGDTLRFSFSAEADRFLHADVNQHDLAVDMALHAPDGQVMLTSRAVPIEYGRRSLSTIGTHSGNYVIELKVTGPAAVSGKIRIDLEPLRMPTAEDRRRIDGDRAWMAARDLRCARTPTDHARALVLLGEALEAYRALGDRYWEARALDLLSVVQATEGSWTMAIETTQQALAVYRTLDGELEEGEALKQLGRLYAGWGAARRGEAGPPEPVTSSEVRIEDLPGFYARFRERLRESLGTDSGLRAGEQLEGLVELTGGADGRVTGVRWLAGSEALREAALAASSTARFAPRRTAFTVRLPFKYALR